MTCCTKGGHGTVHILLTQKPGDSRMWLLVPDFTEERDSGNGRLERADVDHLGCYWDKGRAIGRTKAGL